MRSQLLTLAAIALSAAPALATSDGDLRTALEQRFKGDRTGACVAAAVIDNGATATAYVCADAKTARLFDKHTAFEIGSVTKTMTAALLAELIARGEVTLNDPIAKLLLAGTTVPSFNGRQITIGDIVTHTSGLPTIPPQWRIADVNNPYAGLTDRDLLGALAATRLTSAPGSQWEYSNFAMMVLSYALAKRSGKNYETLLRERLLTPLGMSDTYIAKRPPQVHLAQSGLGLELRRKGTMLTIQTDGQPEFEMGYDSASDFYPLRFDAVLRPKRRADGAYTFTWFQVGDVLEAERR